MNSKVTIMSQLTKALCQFSYGRISLEEAQKLARIYAPKLEADKDALKHKSVTYYARQILQTV